MDLTDCLDIEQSGRAGRITVKIGDAVLPFDWKLGPRRWLLLSLFPRQTNGPFESLGAC